MEQLLFTSTKLQHLQRLSQSRTQNKRTKSHTHTHVLTHMSTPTHLPSRRNLHFITLNPIFPDHFHIWYNTDKHREDDFPAYKCTKCAVNMSKLGLYKCHQGSQLECTLLKHTKLKWYQCLRLNHIFFFFFLLPSRCCGGLAVDAYGVGSVGFTSWYL